MAKHTGSGGDVVIPDGVIGIHREVFRNCSNLTIVTIPSSVTHIEKYAFYGCSGLADVYYGGTQAQGKTIKILDSDAL